MGLFGIGGYENSASLIEGYYIMQDIPGKKISRNLGLIEYTKRGITGDMTEEHEGVFSRIIGCRKRKRKRSEYCCECTSLRWLLSRGKMVGTTYVVAYGNAVILD